MRIMVFNPVQRTSNVVKSQVVFSCICPIAKTQSYDKTSFGMAFGKVKNVSSNKDTANGVVNVGFATYGDNEKVGSISATYLRTGNSFNAETVTVEHAADFGNNANIKDISVGTISLSAKDNFTAESVSAPRVRLGNSPKIGIIEAGETLALGNNINVDKIISHGDMSLGSIDKLDTIIIPDRVIQGNNLIPKIVLESNVITPKKINIILGELNGLNLITDLSPETALEKFKFFQLDHLTQGKGRAISKNIVQSCVKIIKQAK